VRAGEFIAGEAEAAMDTDALVRSACAEIVEQTRDRRAVLIFASGVEHGRHIQRTLEQEHQVECGFITGDTPPDVRAELIARFKGRGQTGLWSSREPLKYLCNVNVLTTGFDAPNIDCVALLRPTMSPGLLSQMVGRGFRLHPAKSDCLILDFGENILRHGPVDALRVPDPEDRGTGEAPAKECPACRALVHAGYAVCPECGHAFPPPERQQHAPRASTEGVLSGQVAEIDYEVQAVYYGVHWKRHAPIDHPRTLRVDYQVGFQNRISEWVCVEHTGYARQKAEAWWAERSDEPCPVKAEQAVEVAEAGALAQTLAIRVRHTAGDPFPKIMGYTLAPKPREPGWDEEAEEPGTEPAAAWIDELSDDDIPF